jgi:hypothetical protein
VLLTQSPTFAGGNAAPEGEEEEEDDDDDDDTVVVARDVFAMPDPVGGSGADGLRH